MKLRTLSALLFSVTPFVLAEGEPFDLLQFVQQDPLSSLLVIAVIFLVIGYLIGSSGKKSKGMRPKYRDHF